MTDWSLSLKSRQKGLQAFLPLLRCIIHDREYVPPIAQRLLWASRKGMNTQKTPLTPQKRNEGRVEEDECRKLFHHFTTIHDVNTMVGGRGLATRKIVSLRRCGSIRCVSLNARRIHHFD